MTNQAALNATLQKVQGIVASQVPIIPIMGAKVYYAYRPGAIGGFYPQQQLISPLDSLYAHAVANSSASTTSPGGASLVAIGALGAVIAVIAVVASVVYIRRKKE